MILGGHEHENWLIERGERFTPIVKADANVRSVAIVTMRLAAEGGPPGRVRAAAADRRLDEGRAEDRRRSQEVDRPGVRRRSARTASNPATSSRRIDVPLYGREAMVRNGPTNLTRADLRRDAARGRHRRSPSSTAAPSASTTSCRRGRSPQYDVIRVLPFGGKIVKATFTGALLLADPADRRSEHRGTGGYLQVAGVPATIDPGGALHAGDQRFPADRRRGQPRLPDRARIPDISDITDLRDIRMAVIDELKDGFRQVANPPTG